MFLLDLTLANSLSASSMPTTIPRVSRRSFIGTVLRTPIMFLVTKLLSRDQWEIERVYDETSNKHKASYVALTNISGKDFTFEKGEKVHFEDAFKYSEAESDALWHASGLIPQMSYCNRRSDYCRRASCRLKWVLGY